MPILVLPASGLSITGYAPQLVSGNLLPYSEFVKDMTPYITACPTPVMIDALKHACIDFFRHSLAFRVWLEPMDMAADQAELVLSGFPYQTELAQTIRLVCDGKELTPVTNEEMIGYDPDYPTATGPRPEYYSTTKKPRVWLSPIPTESLADAFRAYVAVKPTLSSTGVEELYMTEFKDYIVAGALARLLTIPGRHWSDPQLGMMKQSKFYAGIESARIQGNKGHTRRNLRVQMRQWV